MKYVCRFPVFAVRNESQGSVGWQFLASVPENYIRVMNGYSSLKLEINMDSNLSNTVTNGCCKSNVPDFGKCLITNSFHGLKKIPNFFEIFLTY